MLQAKCCRGADSSSAMGKRTRNQKAPRSFAGPSLVRNENARLASRRREVSTEAHMPDKREKLEFDVGRLVGSREELSKRRGQV